PAQRDRSTLLRLGLLSLGCTGAAANLPPCPTRRSSDLVGLPWGCAGRHAPIRTRPSITKAAETLRRMAEASIMAPRPRHGGGPGGAVANSGRSPNLTAARPGTPERWHRPGRSNLTTGDTR